MSKNEIEIKTQFKKKSNTKGSYLITKKNIYENVITPIKNKKKKKIKLNF